MGEMVDGWVRGMRHGRGQEGTTQMPVSEYSCRSASKGCPILLMPHLEEVILEVRELGLRSHFRASVIELCEAIME